MRTHASRQPHSAGGMPMSAVSGVTGSGKTSPTLARV